MSNNDSNWNLYKLIRNKITTAIREQKQYYELNINEVKL